MLTMNVLVPLVSVRYHKRRVSSHGNQRNGTSGKRRVTGRDISDQIYHSETLMSAREACGGISRVLISRVLILRFSGMEGVLGTWDNETGVEGYSARSYIMILSTNRKRGQIAALHFTALLFIRHSAGSVSASLCILSSCGNCQYPQYRKTLLFPMSQFSCDIELCYGWMNGRGAIAKPYLFPSWPIFQQL